MAPLFSLFHSSLSFCPVFFLWPLLRSPSHLSLPSARSVPLADLSRAFPESQLLLLLEENSVIHLLLPVQRSKERRAPLWNTERVCLPFFIWNIKEAEPRVCGPVCCSDLLSINQKTIGESWDGFFSPSSYLNILTNDLSLSLSFSYLRHFYLSFVFVPLFSFALSPLLLPRHALSPPYASFVLFSSSLRWSSSFPLAASRIWLPATACTASTWTAELPDCWTDACQVRVREKSLKPMP